MTAALQALVLQACTELGSAACQDGNHTWGFEGGRPCPHDLTGNCSQAVYVCIVCGKHDYGERGGPGDQDCARHCQHGVARSVAIMAARRDPLDVAWSSAITRGTRMFHRLQLRALRRQPKPRLP